MGIALMREVMMKCLTKKSSNIERSCTWLMATVMVFLVEFSVQAAPAVFVPSWSQSQEALVGSANQSYLSGKSSMLTEKSSVAKFLNQLIPSGSAKHYKEKASHLTSCYEQEGNAGLMNQNRQLVLMNKSESVSKSALRKAIGHQIDLQLEEVKKKSGGIKTFLNAKKRFEKPVKLKLSSFFEFGAKVNGMKQEGRIFVKTPIFDSELVSSAKVAIPIIKEKVDPEIYRVLIKKDIPDAGIKTKVDYGGSTTTLKTSVTKSLASSVYLTLQRTSAANTELSGIEKPDESVKLSYKIRF